MIVQCPACKTRYRFDEGSAAGGTVQLRCTRCGNTFRYDAGPHRAAVPPPVTPVHQEEDFRKIAEMMDDINRSSQGTDDQARPAEEESGIYEEERRPDKGRRILLKILLLIAVLVILVVAVLRISPALRTSFVSAVSPARAFIERVTGLDGNGKRGDLPEKNVVFMDVRESFRMNWMDGQVLVIEGTVVNNNPVGLARIKVRGKLLDASRNVIDERESYCGNILSEEELRNLTGEEIQSALAAVPGRWGIPKTVASGESIPFMLVFATPPKEAGEFIVEAAEAVPAS